VKKEEISKILESLNPAIEAIADPAVKAIIATLLTIINAQQKIIEDLTEKLNTNSKNSSKPPSSEPFKKNIKKKKKSKRKQGGQPGHKGVFRALLPVEEVDHIEICNPLKLCGCGSRIKLTGNYRRHQQHELPRVKAIVTEYQLQSGVCFGSLYTTKNRINQEHYDK
jgi:transposase